jgi:quercetin dioxygenase-like cupin family protein
VKEKTMQIRPLVREQMVRENGADGQRLVPWDVLNAPFEGAWVRVPAGGATGAHSHHEYEIFIAVNGAAELESNGERRSFRVGDIAHFPPHTEHRVVNASASADFEMYSIWWDPAMSDAFVTEHAARHAENAAER